LDTFFVEIEKSEVFQGLSNFLIVISMLHNL